MKEREVPVGKRFSAIVINNKGEEDYIAVECVSTDIENKCSMCVFAGKECCATYYCVERQRKDGKSVYFREVDPRRLPLKRADQYEVVKDKDVSEKPATEENKVSGNDCAEIGADIKSWAIREKAERECRDGFINTRTKVDTDGEGAIEDNGMVVIDICEHVREICECASKLRNLSEFQKEIKPEQEYCFKIYKKSGGIVAEVPFDFNDCLSDVMFEQLPCVIDNRIKDLKYLINKL